jgi:uncharacterized membrane protein
MPNKISKLQNMYALLKITTLFYPVIAFISTPAGFIVINVLYLIAPMLFVFYALTDKNKSSDAFYYGRLNKILLNWLIWILMTIFCIVYAKSLENAPGPFEDHYVEMLIFLLTPIIIWIWYVITLFYGSRTVDEEEYRLGLERKKK